MNDHIFWIRLCQIFIGPYLNMSLFIKEDHFLIYFKMPILFIKLLKSLSGRIYYIQSLLQWYIFDFIESYWHSLEKNRSSEEVIAKSIFFCMMDIFRSSYETIAISPYDELFIGVILILWVEDEIVLLDLNATIQLIREYFEIAAIKRVF